jgi:hypothetical protein
MKTRSVNAAAAAHKLVDGADPLINYPDGAGHMPIASHWACTQVQERTLKKSSEGRVRVDDRTMKPEIRMKKVLISTAGLSPSCCSAALLPTSADMMFQL